MNDSNEYSNYMIQPSINALERNTQSSSEYNYNDPNMQQMNQSQQHQVQTQSDQVVIPFNIPTRLTSTIASTTLLRPQKPGDLLPEEYVPTNLDVCSGRGKRNWNHSGNVAFRDLIQHTTPAYIAARTKNEKTAIVCNIVEDMRALGCKFLKEDKATGRWYDMGDAQARDKVGHSLRDQVTAYNRAQITGAPMHMDTSILEFNAKNDAQSESPTHVRRPSIALSDSGNEAEMRRMSLDTTALFSEFARRPSWIAGSSDNMNYVDEEDLVDGNLDPVTDTSSSNAVPVPQRRNAERRVSSWEFLDTFDYYIDNDVEPISLSNNSIPLTGQHQQRQHTVPNRTISSSSAASATLPTPIPELSSVTPVISEEFRRHYPLSGGAPPIISNDRSNQTHRVQNREVQKSITMNDIKSWDPRMSKGQVDRMLQDSVQSWDPRSSSNMSSIISVRRSAMAGGTTLRRLTSSFKPSDKSMEYILDGIDFGDDYEMYPDSEGVPANSNLRST